MGEAKRTAELGLSPNRWRDIRREPPPDDAHGLLVLVVVTCDCAKGAQVALCAGRMNGEWVIDQFEHSFEIDYWMRLPDFPPPRSAVQ